jgi:CubicO group peptidase (beta-lactamase class C family)
MATIAWWSGKETSRLNQMIPRETFKKIRQVEIRTNRIMTNRARLLPLIAFVFASFTGWAEGTSTNDKAQMLETFRKKFDFPALAAIVVKDGKICDRAAVGVRKLGDSTPVTTNDIWKINSCTKSMTATLAATFIEEGKLRWDTTIAEVFPELKGKMNRQYETVTVEQLLTHRGGVPSKAPVEAIKRAFEEQGVPEGMRFAFLERFGTFNSSTNTSHRSITERRREFVDAVLALPPEAPPGTQIIYSNDGYAIVGAMLDKITGRPWEELMRQKLFKPLHMRTAGFGVPGTLGKVDQPWGHAVIHGKVMPLQWDNPPVIAPGGAVHCSLDDLAHYLIAHLQGEKNGGLLKSETFRQLHAPPADHLTCDWCPPSGNYAYGWVSDNHDWAGGRTLYHGGGNTMWKMVIWMAPEKNSAVVVVTNFDLPGQDSLKVESECNEVANALIKKWLAD